MDELEKIALDCMVQHLRTFYEQSVRGIIADFSEPCSKCSFNDSCNFDWINKMKPLLIQSDVKISVLREHSYKQGSD